MAQQIAVWLDSWMITCSDTYNEIVDFIVRLGTVVLDTTCLFQFLMVMLPSSLWVIISAFLWQVFLTLLKMTRSSEVSHQLTLLWLDVIVLWNMIQSQELFTYLVTQKSATKPSKWRDDTLRILCCSCLRSHNISLKMLKLNGEISFSILNHVYIYVCWG